jgi:hypothetical protein
MPADFFQAMKFYYQNFDFNPYNKAKIKRGKSAHWYYNVLPDKAKYTKNPVYELLSSICLYGPTDEDIQVPVAPPGQEEEQPPID